MELQKVINETLTQLSSQCVNLLADFLLRGLAVHEHQAKVILVLDFQLNIPESSVQLLEFARVAVFCKRHARVAGLVLFPA
jgi:hypothetical protein